MDKIARIVNFRFFLITAVFAIFSIVLALFLPTAVSIIVFAIAVSLLVGMGIVFAINKKVVKSITAFSAFLVVAVCSVNTLTTVSAWTSTIDEKVEYEITAKIESVNTNDYGVGYLLTDFSANGVSQNGNIYLSVSKTDGINISFLKAGDFIKFNCALTFYELIDDNIDGYRYRNDIRYGASIDESEITFLYDSPNFLDTIRNKVYSVLVNALGGYGEVAYGMITGDKGRVGNDITNAYSISGIGHILAVSGLHIGFVVLVLNWILSKLKSNRFVKLAIISIILLGYCFLASFSASVIRASIMCVIGLVADAFGKRRDTLNSLSLAVTVILLIKPIYLFDVGFIMSVSAVLGIILFSRTFGLFFNKFLPKIIANSLSISLSAQIGITPITIITFNSFSLYSVLTNLIIIPLVTIAFILISLALVLTLIIPACSVVLKFSAFPLVVVDAIANFVSLLPLSKITIFAPSLFLTAYLLIFIASEYVKFPQFNKVLSVACIILVLGQLVPYNIPLNREYDVTAVCAYKSVTTIIRNDNEVMLVGDCDDYNSIDSALTKIKESRVNKIFATKIDNDTAITIGKLSEKYGKFTVYCSEKSNYDDFNLVAQKGLQFYTLTEVNDSIGKVRTVHYNGEFIGYGYSSISASIIMLGYGTNTSKLPVDVVNQFGIIRSYVYGGVYNNRIYVVNYDNSYLEEKPYSQVVAKGKLVSFALKNGEIYSN